MELDQTIINWMFTAVGALFGWVLNMIKSEINDLKTSHKTTTRDLSAVKVLVAGDYVTREEFTRHMDKLFDKIDDLTKAVNSKADR